MFIENTGKAPIILRYADKSQPDGVGRKMIAPGNIHKDSNVQTANTLTDSQWTDLQKVNQNGLFFLSTNNERPVLIAHGASCKWVKAAAQKAAAAEKAAAEKAAAAQKAAG